jgi:hypothetical protein
MLQEFWIMSTLYVNWAVLNVLHKSYNHMGIFKIEGGIH